VNTTPPTRSFDGRVGPIDPAVRDAYRAGLSLLPVRDDGTKAPDLREWRDYIARRPTPADMRAFNFSQRVGYGMVSGPASGHRECWDFDCAATFEAFVETAHACGLGAVVNRIRAGYEDQTPGGGRRWIVQFPPSVTWRDCTLARRPNPDGEPKIKTLIELPTFAILAPSNGATHPTQKPYIRLSGGFDTIASYTADERDALVTLARSFDQMPKASARQPAGRPTGTRPGDDYGRRTSWPDVLEPADWTHVYDRGEVAYWRRPGKTIGLSASTNYAGSDLLFVFTSSTTFNPDTSYTKFGAYAVLHHGGDFTRAALALSQQGYGQTSRPAERHDRAATPSLVFYHAARTDGLGQCVLQPTPFEPYSGWFARGAVHLVAGSSGGGKTTLVVDLLQTQARGVRYLGHATSRLDYLVLFADRGSVSNDETLARMQIDPATVPVAHIPLTPNGAASAAAILAAIEAAPGLPAVVFLEGADLLVEDPCKPQIVAPFVVALRQIAEHYSLAMVLSVGAPKARPHEQYQLKRDQVFGSQAWARLSNTVLVLSITGDGTVATRDLVALHRNAPAEKFHLVFTNGRLVVSDETNATERNMVTWMQDTEVFNRQKFRDAFSLSGARATSLLEGFVGVGVLKEKVKHDRTIYAFNPAAAVKVGLAVPRTPVSEVRSFSDTSTGDFEDAKSVRKPVGHGHENARVGDENLRKSEPDTVSPLIPPFSCPLSESDPAHVGVSDTGRAYGGYTRAREGEAGSASARAAQVIRDLLASGLVEDAASITIETVDGEPVPLFGDNV
jgi:hypothetical protein